MLLTFILLFLLKEIRRRLASDWRKTVKTCSGEKDLEKKGVELDDVLSGLSSVGYMVRKSTGAVLVREVSQEQQRMAEACGCSGIYDADYSYEDSGQQRHAKPEGEI